VNQEIISFLKAALECSVLINPVDPGLTSEELIEIGKRAGYLDGEINDALPTVATNISVFGSLFPLPRKRIHGFFLLMRNRNIGILRPSTLSLKNSML
jgi:hypothetical protein